jgi:flagellum-specific peptidoglycan hydrolase FlgJ
MIWQAPASNADSTIKLLVDGKDITESAAPQLLGGRTLVPVRFVAEELGADVIWNEAERTVIVTRDGRSVLLRIDSRLVTYDNHGRTYGLCDVAPAIINERTYVPLRLVSNALGVGVGWQEASRTVSVDSAQSAAITAFYDMKISMVKPGQRITGPTILQADLPGIIPYGATEIKFLIIDPKTAKGTVAIRGNILSASYRWLPDLKISGERILVAAVYDAQGNFLAGDAVPITMAIMPNVALAGITAGQIIKETVSLSANPNFSPNFVKYEITNLDTGKVFLSPEADPQGPYKWTPMMEDNGNLSIRVIAFVQDGLSYRGQPVPAQTALTQKLSLTGVTEGKSIEGPVTLAVARNFQVSQTDYVMLNPSTGSETLLARVGYVSYKWFPGPDLSGTRQLFVRVTDTKGVSHSSSPITVNLTGKARLLLEGVGPEQVISGTVKMKVSSNVALSRVQFTLTNANTGGRKVIAGGSDPQAEYSYTPEQGDAGSWRIQAEGTDESGKAITSESVAVTVYTGKLFTAKPIIEKSQFIGLASGLARNSYKTTGMSAALQTAQSILESGWGQSVPVDKYSGQLSYNLFGIKGTGPAGSVTSNTWEEYNGVAYRIDDEFRAYHNVAESWANHKSLLLTASRYGIFRDVMQSSTQGAWALRRAGYATDSKYPLKLIEIIRLYDLEKLDEIGL